MAHNRKVSLPIPRCPFCDSIMEEVQLRIGENGWEEAWGCDSCHTNHIFPARIEFLNHVRGSRLLEVDERMLHLPK